MSRVTVIWSMTAAICLTLAGVHLLVRFRARNSWMKLLFSFSAAAAASAVLESAAAEAQSVRETSVVEKQATPETSQPPGYAGSHSCRECHASFYALWSTSFHGLNRHNFWYRFAVRAARLTAPVQ